MSAKGGRGFRRAAPTQADHVPLLCEQCSNPSPRSAPSLALTTLPPHANLPPTWRNDPNARRLVESVGHVSDLSKVGQVSDLPLGGQASRLPVLMLVQGPFSPRERAG